MTKGIPRRSAGFALVAALAILGASPALGGPAFRCRLLETTAVLPEFPTYSGYRWIECRLVGAPSVEIDGVGVNNGKCATFGYWYAGRVFASGEPINIPYACMSPVSVSIEADGLISTMKLR